MTATRPALLLALVVLVGCGKSDPPKPADPPKGDAPAAKAGPDTPGKGGTAVQPAVAPSSPAGTGDPARATAEGFVKDLAAGKVPADLPAALTPALLGVIGKPVFTDAERKQGYRPEAAAGWLRRAGAALTGVSPPSGAGGVFTGTFNNGTGRYLVRVTADANPKIDWFQLGTAKAADPVPGGGDPAARDAVVVAFLDALTAGPPVAREDRLPLLAATLSPRLKAQVAEPFNQDKDRGYDHSPGALGRWADGFGGPADAFTRTPADGDAVTVAVTRGGQPKGYTLKLAKGPDGWKVDEVKPQ